VNKQICAIIGGGPAGLFAALSAARVAKTQGVPTCVHLYERNSQAGRKLLTTGAGQCNITRNVSVEQLLGHYGDHGRFLRHALYSLPPIRTMELFEEMGVPLTIRSDAKVFPASLSAKDVLHTLIQACEHAGVTIHYDTRITKVDYNNDQFTLFSEHQKVGEANKVVLATGGKSYSKTGSTGDGYSLLSVFGHTIITPHPALCNITIPQSTIGSCAGISLDTVHILFLDMDGKRRTASGPLLITHKGLSGPVILNSARYFSTNMEITLCWIPKEDGRAHHPQEMERMLVQLCGKKGAANLTTLVHEMGLPARLVQWIFQEAGIRESVRAAEAGKRILTPLAAILTTHTFRISLQGAFSHAMVTAGGVELGEIDSKTMQSRLVPHLYVAGEVLNCDGDTGGYNLQAAWSTGALAGEHAISDFT